MHSDTETLKPNAVILEPFWLSDREVSVVQFQRFLLDFQYRGAKPANLRFDTPHRSHMQPAKFQQPAEPVERISWYDAVMYCNWLSVREGLSTAYELTGDKERSSGRMMLEPHYRCPCNGFRLARTIPSKLHTAPTLSEGPSRIQDENTICRIHFGGQ